MIQNVINGKVYIGSAISTEKRIAQHKRALLRNSHDNQRLQHAWNKYGALAFVFSVIEDVQISSNLIAREQFWIDFFCAASRDNYNICPIAGSTLGRKLSDQTIMKMKLSRKGKKQSKESIAKRVAFHTGRKRSAETCAKISAAKTGKKMHPNTANAIQAAHLGRVNSEETKSKMSIAQKIRRAKEKQKLIDAAATLL